MVNSMAADALDTCVPKTSVTNVLIMQTKQSLPTMINLIFNYLHHLSIEKMTESANIFSCFIKWIQHDKGWAVDTLLIVRVAAGGEQEERAFNLGLAAILGKGVYNFGELVSGLSF